MMNENHSSWHRGRGWKYQERIGEIVPDYIHCTKLCHTKNSNYLQVVFQRKVAGVTPLDGSYGLSPS